MLQSRPAALLTPSPYLAATLHPRPLCKLGSPGPPILLAASRLPIHHLALRLRWRRGPASSILLQPATQSFPPSSPPSLPPPPTSSPCSSMTLMLRWGVVGDGRRDASS